MCVDNEDFYSISQRLTSLNTSPLVESNIKSGIATQCSMSTYKYIDTHYRI